MRPIRVVSSANFKSLTDWWLEVQLFVYRENSRGERTQPCGEPVLVDLGSEMFFPSFTPRHRAGLRAFPSGGDIGRQGTLIRRTSGPALTLTGF
ncbi:hypothetical protein SKAU_G00321240 [Synaphobranchus kaupii]|uniref:Uncharacterized protein n=1 Tax=Synaphobranchus kaupii TaxID=118154 RepID=A0A9Q1IJT3_SYNKA|nr:hypothetical protein SKAU_G00321240 [Synaphobranchus kaupii]